MENFILQKSSILGLIRHLAGETRTFIRQEAQLARTEVTENVSSLARKAVTLALGAFVAYAGLIVFLTGLGWLLAWAFQRAGLSPIFAGFVGLAAIGLLIVTVGGLFLLVAIKAISRQSLRPERAVSTLQQLKGSVPAAEPKPAPLPEPAPSSAELLTRVEATEARLGATVEELSRRMNPDYLRRRMAESIKRRLFHFGLVAMAAAILSALVIKRRIQRA
jgi:Putative Actinobacterial Holin-X, holin superfamily III